MKHILLTSENFKEAVFKRDYNCCVVCGEPAVAAHHLIDRTLFIDGGYYINNGVSLCNQHYIDAETMLIPCEYLRDCAKITNIVFPDTIGLTESVIE